MTTAPVTNLWGTTSDYAYLCPSSSTVNRCVANGSGAILKLSAGTAIGAGSAYATGRTTHR